jgi:hypothetical protein
MVAIGGSALNRRIIGLAIISRGLTSTQWELFNEALAKYLFGKGSKRLAKSIFVSGLELLYNPRSYNKVIHHFSLSPIPHRGAA